MCSCVFAYAHYVHFTNRKVSMVISKSIFALVASPRSICGCGDHELYNQCYLNHRLYLTQGRNLQAVDPTFQDKYMPSDCYYDVIFTQITKYTKILFLEYWRKIVPICTLNYTATMGSWCTKDFRETTRKGPQRPAEISRRDPVTIKVTPPSPPNEKVKK